MVVIPLETFVDFGGAASELPRSRTALDSEVVVGDDSMLVFCSNMLMRDVVGGIDVVSVGLSNTALSAILPCDDRVRGLGGTAGVRVAATLILVPLLPSLPLLPLPVLSLSNAKGGTRAFATKAA